LIKLLLLDISVVVPDPKKQKASCLVRTTIITTATFILFSLISFLVVYMCEQQKTKGSSSTTS